MWQGLQEAASAVVAEAAGIHPYSWYPSMGTLECGRQIGQCVRHPAGITLARKSGWSSSQWSPLLQGTSRYFYLPFRIVFPMSHEWLIHLVHWYYPKGFSWVREKSHMMVSTKEAVHKTPLGWSCSTHPSLHKGLTLPSTLMLVSPSSLLVAN